MAFLAFFDGDCAGESPIDFEVEIPPVTPVLASDVTKVDDLILVRAVGNESSFIKIYGPPPVAFEPPPLAPPEIGAQLTVVAAPRLRNRRGGNQPGFWVRYRLLRRMGYRQMRGRRLHERRAVSPASLGAGAVRALERTGAVKLTGLQPATIYHFRFVAQSSGGGPVRGVGGTPGVAGGEGTFTTPRSSEMTSETCPNEARRLESNSTALPDCRAYEMVSPVEKNGGDTTDPLVAQLSARTRLTEAASDGNSFTYSSYRAFPGSAAAPWTSQYVAYREGDAWTSKSISPARSGQGVFLSGEEAFGHYFAFTPDLCHAWLVNAAPPLLDPAAIPDFPDLYREDRCGGSPTFKALTTRMPERSLETQIGFGEEEIELQGFSADGNTTLFRGPWKMSQDGTEAAPGQGPFQTYEATPSGVNLVCVLPNGVPLTSDCTAGAAAGQYYLGYASNLTHAISDDGSRIYWTAAASGRAADIKREAARGRIFVRLNGDETKPVSEAAGAGKTTLKAEFLGASADGGQALFEVTEGAKAGRLFEYSLESETSSQIAGQLVGVAGLSEDLSHIYFVSREAIGGDSSAGRPNLYLWRDGQAQFITTLGEEDVNGPFDTAVGVPSNTDPRPIYHVAKATPDGNGLIFVSKEPLTGFDNVDAVSGRRDLEVFHYDADDSELACVSCAPSGASPRGREVEIPGGSQIEGGGAPWTAASIPGAQRQLFTPRSQSNDGGQVFFTSYTSLLPRDTNNRSDVYLWSEARPGSECEDDQPSYSPRNAGCISLISTGKSPQDSEFLDSSPSGNDAFFITEESILPQDPGLVDVYDARVNGGLPVPVSHDPCTIASDCRRPPAPPAISQLGSAVPTEGNPESRRKCRKGFRRKVTKGKVRCVKSGSQHRHRHGGKPGGRNAKGGSK